MGIEAHCTRERLFPRTANCIKAVLLGDATGLREGPAYSGQDVNNSEAENRCAVHVYNNTKPKYGVGFCHLPGKPQIVLHGGYCIVLHLSSLI